MPDLPCSHCRTRCHMFIESQYNLAWVAAWIGGADVPECLHYKPMYQGGVA